MRLVYIYLLAGGGRTDLWLKGGKVLQVKGKILPIFMAAKGAQLWSLLHFLLTFSSYFLPSDQFHSLFFFSFFCRSLQLRKRKQNAQKMSILSKPRSKRGISLKINSLDAVMLCFLKIYLAVDN